MPTQLLDTPEIAGEVLVGYDDAEQQERLAQQISDLVIDEARGVDELHRQLAHQTIRVEHTQLRETTLSPPVARQKALDKILDLAKDHMDIDADQLSPVKDLVRESDIIGWNLAETAGSSTDPRYLLEAWKVALAWQSN